MRVIRSLSALLLLVAPVAGQLTADQVAQGVSLFNKYSQMAGSDSGSAITGLASGATVPTGATSTATKSPFNQLVTGVQNGAQVGQDVQACYTSVQGKGDQIASAYNAASSSFADPSSLGSAGNAAQLLFTAYMASSADADTMWKLYQIYTNQQTNGASANAAQDAAYKMLTPECDKAFSEIDTAYGNAQTGAANFLTSTDSSNSTCYAYGQTTSQGYQVRFNLCVNPSKTQPQGAGLAEKINANFTNYGVPLCNLTFYVKDLETAYNHTPAWLPSAETAYPDGFPSDTSVQLSALLPYDGATYDTTATLFDIKKGWFACPFGKNTAPPTPARTTKPSAPAVPIADTILANQDSCFLTASCKSIVSQLAGDDCGAYHKLFTSSCYTCSADVVKAAKEACMVGCSEKQCAYTPAAATTQSSGAGSLRLSAFLAMATGLALAAGNYLFM